MSNSTLRKMILHSRNLSDSAVDQTQLEDGDTLVYDSASDTWVPASGGGSSGTTGSGTQADPFVNADGSGGIQTQLNALGARGGHINLPTKAYAVTTPITTRVSTQGLFGKGRCPYKDPNGHVNGDFGTLLVSSVTAIKIGSDTGERTHQVEINGLGIQGSEYATYNPDTAFGTPKIGISLDQSNDQTRITGNAINFCNIGIYSNATSDHVWIEGNSVLYCSIPIRFELLTIGYYTVITKNVFADCPYQVQLLGGAVADNEKFLRFTNNAVIRCGMTDHNNVTNPCNVYSGRKFTLIEGNIFDGAGYDLLASTAHIADELILADGGDNQTVVGNTFKGSGVSGGFGIRIYSDNNYLADNLISACDKYYKIETGAADNTIIHRGLLSTQYTDNGTRTRINGVSTNAGDPNSAGDWNGVTKPNGLTIYDTSGKLMWFYHSSLTNGRQLLNPGQSSGRIDLASTFSLSGSADAWQDVTGMSVTLVAGGIYLVTATVCGVMIASAFDSLSAKFYDSTNSVDASPWSVVCGGAATVFGTGTVIAIVDCTTGAKTTKLQGKRSGTNVTLGTTQFQQNTSNADVGGTAIVWQRIA